MLNWNAHGAAWVSALALADGTPAKAVLLAGRDNPKGAVIALGTAGSQTQTRPMGDLLDSLRPDHLIEIACMQERLFGAYNLESPE